MNEHKMTEHRMLRYARMMLMQPVEASTYCRTKTLLDELQYYKVTYYNDVPKAKRYFRHILRMRCSNF